MKKKSNYSEEFKRDALQLLKSSGKSRNAIERDLGLSQALLRQWEIRYQVTPDSQGLERSELEQLKAEVRRLQKENETLRMEREILKKTVQIFSEPSK
jgi:transposase